MVFWLGLDSMATLFPGPWCGLTVVDSALDRRLAGNEYAFPPLVSVLFATGIIEQLSKRQRILS